MKKGKLLKKEGGNKPRDCTSFSADWKLLPLEWNKNLNEKGMLFVYLSVYFLSNFQHSHRAQELKQVKAQSCQYELTKFISIHQPSSYHSLQQVTSFFLFCQQEGK